MKAEFKNAFVYIFLFSSSSITLWELVCLIFTWDSLDELWAISSFSLRDGEITSCLFW